MTFCGSWCQRENPFRNKWSESIGSANIRAQWHLVFRGGETGYSLEDALREHKGGSPINGNLTFQELVVHSPICCLRQVTNAYYVLRRPTDLESIYRSVSEMYDSRNL